jgi:hypothetical protein
MQPGQILADRYLVERLVRSGGMGAIYKCTDVTTRHHVAIKILLDKVPGETRQRFEREVSLLSELSHPGIVRYLGHGLTAEGALYLAMEWLEGEDLSEHLSQQERLTIEQSLALIRRVCEALVGAHARGIVHRDLKPANLFLPHRDPYAVKVLDFGIARQREGVSTLTHGGTLLGTVGYMSPEQVMCEADIDARTDVFAIGCVLFQCLTGKEPFASPHNVGVLAKVLRAAPKPPSALLPGLSKAIDELVLRLLAKKREDRPGDAAAVLELIATVDAAERAVSTPERSASFPSLSEQRIVSVILGAPPRDGPGFTAASEHRVRELLAELSRRHAAEVAWLNGGALLVVLGGLGEANDRASQAARCALALRECCPALTLGIATGLADTSGKTPVGAAIDRAAELLAAMPKEGRGVAIDTVTSGLLDQRFEVEQVGATNVLVGPSAAPSSTRLLMGRPTPCLGRGRELRALHDVLDECVNDSLARMALVTGPPGIGKSRLAVEWLAKERDGHHTVLVARSDPVIAGSAMSIVQQLVRRSAKILEATPREIQLDRLRTHMSQSGASATTSEFLAEILGLNGDGTGSALLRAARSDPDIMREQARRTLHAWLEGETSRQPVIIILEDLHWGDQPSVAFLTEAVSAAAKQSLMIVALARPEVEKLFPEACRAAALHIRLPGLTPRAARDLVQTVLEQGVAAELVDRVVHTADGNPFYLEEIIRSVAGGSLDWPDTVLAMAQSRLEKLDPIARYVLRAASTFGETWWDAGVAEIVGGQLDISEATERLLRDELVFTVSHSRYGASQEYRFRHALFRDAAYEMMTPDDRRASHRAAALWLERTGEKDARLLTDHFEAAGDLPKALPWCVRAARSAIEAGDIAQTLVLADRGIRLGASGMDLGQLLLSAAYAEMLRSQADLEMLDKALDLLPAHSATWWLALSLLILGAMTNGQAERVGGFVKLVRDAPLTSDLSLPYAQALFTLVGGLVLAGKGDVAALVLKRTTEVAAYNPRTEPIFEAFLRAARAALAAVSPVDGKWQLEFAFVEGKKAAELLRVVGARYAEGMALNYFSVAAMHLGRYEEAIAACHRSVALGTTSSLNEGATERTIAEWERELRTTNSFRLNESWARLFLAKAYIRLDKPELGLEAVAPLEGTTDQSVLQMLPITIAEARLKQSLVEEASVAAAAACEGGSPRLRPLAACVLAHAQLARGNAGESLRTVEATWALHPSLGLESYLDLLTLHAEALRRVGDTAGARKAAAQAREAVLAVADTIEDAELRASFCTNVPPCALALELARNLEG